MYYVLAQNLEERESLRKFCLSQGVGAVFHYVPLHLSPMGEKLGYNQGDLPMTEEYSSRLLRLPLYAGLSRDEQQRVVKSVLRYFEEKSLKAHSRLANSGA